MSALSKLEKLMYTIGIVDKATGPVNKIMDKINQLSTQTASAQDQMMGGFMGAAGGALMLVGSLNPAIAANQALGEVSSLGVASSSLEQLNQTAINFTAQYGGNAADVISASYDIQSSIAGLTGQELSAFTHASAVMAKGTKSDASTATNYLGTMYGIYQKNATEMGKSQWVEQLAGQTATAVRMFKTNGDEMSGAFTSLGASAQSHGIDMAESMAIMGQLQATMSGSEAGTKYKAFLSGIGSAQKALGLQLTDTQGKLLPMADVLEKLQGKFGDIDTVAKSDALKKAFGSDEATALIKLLLPQLGQLKGNIAELNNQTGMQTATDMANAQTDAWLRLSGGFNAAATAMGQAVLPIIEPVVDMLASMLRGVLWLTQEFPTLTGVLAAAAVGVVGLMVAFNTMNMIVGMYRFALIGAGVATNGVAISTRLWQFGLMALRVVGFLANIAAMGAYLAIIGLYRGVILAAQVSTKLWQLGLVALRVGGFLANIAAIGAYIGVMGLYRGAMLAAQGVTWLFNTALLANPIGLVIAGVVALVAAVAGLIFYWDAIVAAFKDSTWGQALIGIFDSVMSVFSGLIDNVKWVLEALGLMDGKEMTINSKVEEVTKTAVPISTENTLSTKLSSTALNEHQVFNADALAANNLANMNTQVYQVSGIAPMAANQVLNTEAFATNNLANTNMRFNQVNGFEPVAANQALNAEAFATNNLANTNMRFNQVSGFEPVAANQALNTEAFVANNLANTNTRLNQVSSFAPVATNQALSTEAYTTNNLANTQFNQVSGLSPVAASLVESQTFNETTAHSERIQQYQENNQQLAKVSRPRIQRTQYFQQSKQHTNNNSNSNADNSKRVYIDNVVMKSDNLDHDFEQLMELAG